MTSVGSDDEGNRQTQEECCEPCEQLRTYLVYHLDRVEHHAADQHRRMVILDSGLEIELELLRELNNCLDQFPPLFPAAVAPHARSETCESAPAPASKNFHPGFKVTVVLNDGDEKRGIVRWTQDDPTGPDLQLL
ncbi:MAG TPA: hypothetical protein VJQ77_06075 [Novosphingobium sp.]|nr:hypothetical protein [Novosphingobium sp.]